MKRWSYMINDELKDALKEKWEYIMNDEVKKELKEKKNLIVISLLSIVIFMLTGFSIFFTVLFTMLSIIIFKTLGWVLWQFLKPINMDKASILKRKKLVDKIAYVIVIIGILLIALKTIFFITDLKGSSGHITYDIYYGCTIKDNEK